MKLAVTEEQAVDRFREMLKIKTVWPRDGEPDYDEFRNFVPTLRKQYPKAMEVLSYTPINEYGILLKWDAKSQKRSPSSSWGTMTWWLWMDRTGPIRRLRPKSTTTAFIPAARQTTSALSAPFWRRWRLCSLTDFPRSGTSTIGPPTTRRPAGLHTGGGQVVPGPQY